MQKNIVSLPAKADVLAALRATATVHLDVKMWGPVSVTGAAEIEDGSGESWNVKGTVVVGGQTFACRVYCRTDHSVRFGTGETYGFLEIEVPKPAVPEQPEPAPETEREWVICVFPNGPGGYISAFPTSTLYGITGGEVTVFLTDDLQSAKRFPDSQIRANWNSLQKSTWQILPAPEE